MPDPFSIALGVVQVAETGFKLADTIYTYTRSVRKAEKQFRPVADYVKLTCTVLEQVASHLQDQDLHSLYKPALLATAQDAIEGCERAFESLNAYLKTLSNHGSGNGERAVMSTKAKMAWPWKSKELDSHQVHLERYKSTFDLLLSALTFVNSSRTVRNTSTMKMELQRLMKAEAEAKKQENLFRPAGPPDFSLCVPDSDAITTGALKARETGALEVPMQPALPPMLASTNDTFLASSPTPLNSVENAYIYDLAKSNAYTQSNDSGPEDKLLTRLNDCASAMELLSTTLNKAIAQCRQSGKYQKGSLLLDFAVLDSAIRYVESIPDTKTPLDFPVGHFDSVLMCHGEVQSSCAISEPRLDPFGPLQERLKAKEEQEVTQSMGNTIGNLPYTSDAHSANSALSRTSTWRSQRPDSLRSEAVDEGATWFDGLSAAFKVNREEDYLDREIVSALLAGMDAHDNQNEKTLPEAKTSPNECVQAAPITSEGDLMKRLMSQDSEEILASEEAEQVNRNRVEFGDNKFRDANGAYEWSSGQAPDFTDVDELLKRWTLVDVSYSLTCPFLESRAPGTRPQCLSSNHCEKVVQILQRENILRQYISMQMSTAL